MLYAWLFASHAVSGTGICALTLGSSIGTAAGTKLRQKGKGPNTACAFLGQKTFAQIKGAALRGRPESTSVGTAVHVAWGGKGTGCGHQQGACRVSCCSQGCVHPGVPPCCVSLGAQLISSVWICLWHRLLWAVYADDSPPSWFGAE